MVPPASRAAGACDKHSPLDFPSSLSAPRHNTAAYCGDRVVCEARDEHTDRLLFYREPTPEGIGEAGPGRGAGAPVLHMPAQDSPSLCLYALPSRLNLQAPWSRT